MLGKCHHSSQNLTIHQPDFPIVQKLNHPSHKALTFVGLNFIMSANPLLKRVNFEWKESIMANLAKVGQSWKPLCADTQFEIPTDHPVIIMENRQTKEHAYFDIKLDRFLSQQEAFDTLTGNYR